jgi:hypothetical protein
VRGRFFVGGDAGGGVWGTGTWAWTWLLLLLLVAAEYGLTGATAMSPSFLALYPPPVGSQYWDFPHEKESSQPDSRINDLLRLVTFFPWGMRGSSSSPSFATTRLRCIPMMVKPVA